MDLSSRVVEVAGKLKENRKFEYDWRQEGEWPGKGSGPLTAS